MTRPRHLMARLRRALTPRPSALSALAAVAVLVLATFFAYPSGGQSLEEMGIRLGLPGYVPTDPPTDARVMYEDSTISINTQCPVRGGRIDPHRHPIYVNGRPVGFCCHPCPVTFSFDPEKYLRKMKASLTCPVRPARRVVLDSSLQARINHDIFFFSSMDALQRFQKEPLRYAGKLTDPVSHTRFKPSKTSPHVSFRGRDYYFASDSTRTVFQGDPERYFQRQTGT